MEELSGESKESRRLRDRWKDAIKEREVKKSIITHWRGHKEAYVVGAVMFAAGITCAIMRGVASQPISVSVGDAASGSSNTVVTGKKVVMDNVSFISANRQGSPSWVVRCIETGEVETSQRKMAESMGIHQHSLSKHLNGHQSDAEGYHFERLCLAG